MDKQLPEPSYRLRRSIEISSPLGDEHKIEEEILYFPSSYADLVTETRTRDANTVKGSFIGEMKEHLLSHPGREFAYGGVLDESAQLDAELENEWNYYCEGIYGICTLHASAQEIIEKEIAVKKLIPFLETHDIEELKNSKDNLSQIIEDYDKVSNLFALINVRQAAAGNTLTKL